MVFGLSLPTHVFAAQMYRVSAQFSHLGESVGKPMMEVEVGEKTVGEYSVEGRNQYKFVVLVKPVANGQVYVSFQFSSGQIDIQPNLMVDLGKTRKATIEKVLMKLVVEEVVEGESKSVDPEFQVLTQN